MKEVISVICAFVCLVPAFRTLTPPRILYGGWTPIVPGHPYYFGPVRDPQHQTYHPVHHQQYQTNHPTQPEQPQYQTHHHMHYGEPALTYMPEHEVEHHVEYVSPEHYQTYEKPKDAYQPPVQHSNHPQEHEGIPYGHKPQKDIYSYYPPQSAYDGPKEIEYGYKPVYFEVPRKHFYQNAADLSSLKDLPIDLKSIYPMSEKAYLKMRPLNFDALKEIGHINAGQLHHHLAPEAKYPVIKDSSGGIPKAFSAYKNMAPLHAPYTVHHFPNNPRNTYKGSAVKPVGYLQLKRPLNPIETKYIGNAHSNVPRLRPQQGGYEHLNLPIASLIGNPNSYIGPRYVKPQDMHSSRYVGKNRFPTNKNYVVPAYRSPTHVAPVNYPANKSPANLVANYLHKDVKLHSLYKNPAVVTHIRGAPALVEREVAIVHVPVSKVYPLDSPGEFLYHTASTPESTHVLDINHTVPITVLENHLPLNNESYTHITLDFGKGPEQVTLVEPTVDSQIDPPVQKSHNQQQYIYVSYNGIHGTDMHNNVDHQQADGKRHPSNPQDMHKQFFHAYYGPSDHVPPPGYVKMTVQEFDRLFQNAEIRYIDKDLDSQSSTKKEYHKPTKS